MANKYLKSDPLYPYLDPVKTPLQHHLEDPVWIAEQQRKFKEYQEEQTRNSYKLLQQHLYSQEYYINNIKPYGKVIPNKNVEYMPVRKIAAVEEPQKLNKRYSARYLRELLLGKLINQDEAIDRIVPYLTMYNAGMSSPTRPVANFLLLGPTGTGKTRTVEAVAEVLNEIGINTFTEGDNLIRVDCSTYKNSHEVAKLIGSPPGYLGHSETKAIFTTDRVDAISKNGPGVILFDELEKAHPSFYEIMLSILDKGRLQLGTNQTVSFTKTIIFFTSNLGAKEMLNLLNPHMGFQPASETHESIQKRLVSIGENAAKKKFAPEFFNRLDEVITYHPLSADSMQKILNLELEKVWKLLFQQGSGLILLITPEVKEYLSKAGFNLLYGARELNRTIQRKLVQPFANFVTENEFQKGTAINAQLVNGEVYFKKVDLEIPHEADEN